jgi:acetyl-CoA synthetase
MRKNQVAIIWEPNDPKQPEIRLTYGELFEKVKQFANGLKKIGVEKGDRVAIYLPMVPELAIAMLACARIGAIHSIVFAGFSATALSERIDDAKAKVMVTSDGAYSVKKSIPIKSISDDALVNCPSVKNTIVLKHTGDEINWTEKDIWWDKLLEQVSTENTAEVMDSEDVLFILYTSGSTGKPKGVVHTTAATWCMRIHV